MVARAPTPWLDIPAPLAAVVAGAMAGFLVLNWHPARIFLGDVGSVALGVGIYTAVVAPTSTGLTVSGTTASAPVARAASSKRSTRR